MIEVYATQGGGKCRLLVTGHATEGEDRDIVCAGVSALVQSLALFAADRPDRCRRLRCYVQPGEVFFSCYGVEQGFSLVLHGLAAIAREHPDCLAIRSLVAVDDK